MCKNQNVMDTWEGDNPSKLNTVLEMIIHDSLKKNTYIIFAKKKRTSTQNQ